jgi:O-acetyl-ADP-ribose deacetylase
MSVRAIGRARLELVQGDITRADTVAIANAANAMLLGGGGVDGAIHRAAGPELADALREVKRELPGGLLRTGGAVVTSGFQLSAHYVIHCVGPIYGREREQAPALLASCYREALKICDDRELDSIAFPAISTGAYGYPLEEAAETAIATVAWALPRQQHP